jgi:hypothetical protein
MHVTRLLVGLATLTVLILAPAAEALACSCPSSGPPCQNAFQVDAIFAGTVRSITALPEDGPPLRPGEARIPRAVRVEFAAVVSYRGAPAVSVTTAGSGPACGYEFKQGERYLVYASRETTGPGLVASHCSRTRLFTDADEDLRFLQTLSAPGETRARLYGAISHWEPDLAAGDHPRDFGPVQDVAVTVRGPGSFFDAWTDERGHYEVRLPPGKYEVTVLPPAGFSARYLQRTVELPDVRACSIADFGVQFDGRIRGVVRQSSGEPAEKVAVQIMAAEQVGTSGNIQTLRASSDAFGRFEFIEVPPGRYVVGVDLTRRIDADVVYPPTLYPGTPDGASATVVELAGGQQRDLELLTLPPARRPHTITGTVVFEDGSPASGAFISLVDGSATWRQVAAGIKTASDGTFSFAVHEGLGYIARASYWDEQQRKQVQGTVGPFVVTRETGPLKVVLSALR